MTPAQYLKIIQHKWQQLYFLRLHIDQNPYFHHSPNWMDVTWFIAWHEQIICELEAIDLWFWTQSHP